MTRIGSDEDDEGVDAELSNEELQDTAVSHDYDAFAAAQSQEESDTRETFARVVELNGREAPHADTGYRFIVLFKVLMQSMHVSTRISLWFCCY